MKKFISLIGSVGVAMGADAVIHSVFEHTRHGARSPDDAAGFKVGPNSLTAEGKR